jgi:DNA-binding transcriptional MerR regulator
VKGFRTREVAELIGMSPPQVRAFARTGLLRPARGPRRAYFFTFQDLVLLRTAKHLQRDRISARRVRRALLTLARQLPPGRPLTEVRVTADEHRILASDRGATWNPETGQLLLTFETPAPGTAVRPVPTGPTAAAYYRLGCELEVGAPSEAREAYAMAIRLDPTHAGAHVNLGRMDQAEGLLLQAIDHYCAALDHDPEHATAAFNLGSAFSDLGWTAKAIGAYARALRLDPSLADAHYNLALLYERLGRQADAIQHLRHYRALKRSR